MTLWMRFPPRMRRALAVSLESAGTRGCEELAIEHLAATVCRDPQSAATFIFESAGLPHADLTKRLQQLEPAGSIQRQRAARLSPEVLQLLQSAANIADKWKHQHVGTEHLALALITTSSPAGSTLREMGLTNESAEAGLRRWIAEEMPRQRVLSRRPWVGAIASSIAEIPYLPAARLENLRQQKPRSSTFPNESVSALSLAAGQRAGAKGPARSGLDCESVYRCANAA